MPNSSPHCLLQHSVEVQYISWQSDLLKAVWKVHIKIVTLLPFELLLCQEVFLKLKFVLQVWQKKIYSSIKKKSNAFSVASYLTDPAWVI